MSYGTRRQLHPFGGMHAPGRRVMPAPGLACGPSVPQELAPMVDLRPGMAPGLNQQLSPEAWVFRPDFPPDRIIRVNGFLALAAGAIGQPVGVQWPDDGYVLGVTACARGDGSAAGLSSLAVQIQAGDQGQFITGNGTSADYVLFDALARTETGATLLYRAVARQETWTLTCRNYHAATTYTPEVTFKFKTLRG